LAQIENWCLWDARINGFLLVKEWGPVGHFENHIQILALENLFALAKLVEIKSDICSSYYVACGKKFFFGQIIPQALFLLDFAGHCDVAEIQVKLLGAV